MKTITKGALLLCSALAALQAQTAAIPIPGDPLLYFYNPRLDALGQDLQKAAGEVSNGQVYETQLSNLDAVARLASDRIFSSGRRAALAKIEAARTWGFLFDRFDTARKSQTVVPQQQKEWQDRMAELKKQVAATAQQSDATVNLQPLGDILEAAGKAKQVAETGNFLQERKLANITPADLRIAARVQELVGNIGAVITDLAKNAGGATSRSVAEQMKVDLAKAELDHLKTLMGIEEKRAAGQKDVKDLLSVIGSSIKCDATNCVLSQDDDEGIPKLLATVERSDAIEDTLQRFQGDKVKVGLVILLLENYGAMASRADLPMRLADLRAAVEDRRFAIRREAIMARTYEQIFLVGAQRIAAYYKGGIKPETLGQFANALSTAGLIPAISLK